MGTVSYLAEEVKRGLERIHSTLRRTVTRKLAAVVAAVVQTQTANTAVWATVLPIETERPDMRLQWIARLLANPLLDVVRVMEPFARQCLSEAAANGRVVVLSMDQTELGDRFAILMISVRVGDRALPLIWAVEAGAANLGFEAQRALLEIVLGWLPASASVLLAADRFYPSAPLFTWLQSHRWSYRLRLKGNHALAIGCPEVASTGDFARGVTQRSVVGARRFESGIETTIGVLHERGHEEPWIVAMDCVPSAAAVRDSGLRWCIEPMFSDFKSRGFGLEDTQLRHPERVARLVLIMALALYWCVDTGSRDARESPTPLETRAAEQQDPEHWSFRKLARSCLSWFQRGLRKLLRCAELGQPLPSFGLSILQAFSSSG
jgi:Transposase DDE domain